MPVYDLRQDHSDRHILLFANDASACSYAKGTTPRGVSVEIWEGSRFVAVLTGQRVDLCEGAWYLADTSTRRLLAAFNGLGEGPVVVGGMRYGILRYDPGLGWRFTPEIVGIKGLNYKTSARDALPATVRRAMLVNHYSRYPSPQSHPRHAA